MMHYENRLERMEDDLYRIFKLIDQHRLGHALDALENVMLTDTKSGGLDQLMEVKTDYGLMMQYWQNGFNDAQRGEVYDRLLQRLYTIAANVDVSRRNRSTHFWIALEHHPWLKRNDWSAATVCRLLEDFTASEALLGLEQPHVAGQKKRELYAKHEELMKCVFAYVVTAPQWTDGEAVAFQKMLLSPTVAVIDQQLMVSAVMLSAMLTFDVRKFKVLLEVYRQATVEEVRQRALVGWVMCLDERKAALYAGIQPLIDEVLSDEQCCRDLVELQMQMVYCRNAERDNREIQDKIIPDMMRGSNIKLTQHGLVEMDEDSLEDILHPEKSERDMEQMEQSMSRMADMQKQGVDIYFSGFSQMKRLPFFGFPANWFVPFYAQHPSISTIWENTRGKRFLRFVTEAGAFCDSDKYSLVMAFEKVVEHLPANMLEMIEKGEADPMPIGGEIDREEQSQPAYIRRMYLQNLYRFFMLYPDRSEFVNPFARRQAFFMTKPMMCGGQMQTHLTEMASFLMKRDYDAEALKVIENSVLTAPSPDYCLLRGTLLQRSQEGKAAQVLEWFARAVEMEQGNERALAGYARAAFNCQRYDEALATYMKLLEMKPESKSYMLNAAICLTNLHRNDEAEKVLFKLNYLYPDDMQVSSVLAWVLTLVGKYEQAETLFQQLNAGGKPRLSDILNHGYCYWLAGKTRQAIDCFRLFKHGEGNEDYDLEKEFMVTEVELLAAHDICEVDIRMMLDAVR